jgi:hypothetical protein
VIEAGGAPFDQGRKQGAALRAQIESVLRNVRVRYGWLEWYGALRRAHTGPGRAQACFLPQQHERLQGIARAAGVSLASLELCAALQRVAGVGSCKGARLEGSFEVPPVLEPVMTLRRSIPDAGGVPSVELTAAPWAGCLAGVNAEGIALVCLEDHGRREPPLRVLAQDLLFRARALDPVVDHLRRRAAYAGGSGVLLLVDATGAALRAELSSGQLRVREASSRGALALEPTVRIDAAARTLVWRGAPGTEPRGRVSLES